MNSRAQLDQYLDSLRARLRRVLYARGAAAAAAALLVITVLAALALGRTGFSDQVVIIARVLLALAVAATAAYVWISLRRLASDEGAAAFERSLPGQSGRIDTYLQERRRERAGAATPLIDLLAEDAGAIAERTPATEALPWYRWGVPAGVAVVAVALIAGLVLQGPGLWGDGMRRLWLGTMPEVSRIAEAAGGIAVRPGDVSVRRNQDLPIAALVQGGASGVQVHVRFGESGEWEAAPMEADGKGGYGFTLFAVREQAKYYVTAGKLRSAEHSIAVVDLPQIESMRLTYNYPAWTGLKGRTEESGGDIRAVEGTRVGFEVVTNAPMETPLLIVNGAQDGMKQNGVTTTGNLTVTAPGHYRIATRFGDEVVALTEDFVIDVVPDEKPSVEILRPGRDYQATNIEEVPVSVKAQDDFRLESLELKYSVNGGEWRTEKLDAGASDIQAAALLRLEEMQQPGPGNTEPLLVPGDLVSYYAMARDRRANAQTDLFLIQVQPFDRRFTQGQGGGGGGGGGGEEDEGVISQRQREVLLATWNLARADETKDERESERRADSARMLSEVQKTLADQASTLVDRARARLLDGADKNISSFVDSLEEATKAMRPAAQELSQVDLQKAIAHEQRALQHLLRAEATYRDIQVAQQQGGGGGGGGSQAGRDVSEMTELELDLEKNQYETEPQMTAQQKSQSEDETLRKLKELARRQEQLAREANRNQAAPEAQKWQQEQLRREAEELRRELEQLAQQNSQGQQGQQGSRTAGPARSAGTAGTAGTAAGAPGPAGPAGLPARGVFRERRAGSGAGGAGDARHAVRKSGAGEARERTAQPRARTARAIAASGRGRELRGSRQRSATTCGAPAADRGRIARGRRPASSCQHCSAGFDVRPGARLRAGGAARDPQARTAERSGSAATADALHATAGAGTRASRERSGCGSFSDARRIGHRFAACTQRRGDRKRARRAGRHA